MRRGEPRRWRKERGWGRLGVRRVIPSPRYSFVAVRVDLASCVFAVGMNGAQQQRHAIPPKPISIIAQVAGSGAAGGSSTGPLNESVSRTSPKNPNPLPFVRLERRISIEPSASALVAVYDASKSYQFPVLLHLRLG